MRGMKVEALGQTVFAESEVVLVASKMPPDCMVLFVSMDTWAEIKDTVEVIHG